jgi:RNA polymerase sigma-70 factor (ECF subfamily)
MGEELIAALRDMLAALETSGTEHQDDGELYEATLGTLHSISRGRYGFSREEAEELVQETWLLFLEKRQSVRTPRAWLRGAIANLCRQEIDRRCRDRNRIGEMADAGVPPVSDDVLSLRQALTRVDPRSRDLCIMIGLEQRSYEEVGNTAGIPIGSIGPLYMRAKERLRKTMTAASLN